jgi:hypothetical protein
MKPFRLNRRAVLRGAGGIAIGLPFLEIMADGQKASAQAANVPKRFIVFFTPNGSIRENWLPTGSGSSFTLSKILAPLEPFKNQVLVIDGLKNTAAVNGPGDGHQTGMGTMLTGTELLDGTVKGGCDTCPAAGLAGGISIDQAIAKKIGTSTKLSSLEFGVQAKSTGAWAYTSYQDANKPLQAENNPATIFSRAFADVGGDQGAIAKLQAERKTILDGAMTSYSSLVPRLGASDAAKVDHHLSQIRDLETRLAAGGLVGASCMKPAQPTIDYKSNDGFPAAGKLQMDLMVMALACDLTRVATIQWENSVGGVRFSWIGMTRGHHDMSHDPDTTTDTVDKLTQINVWYSQQLAYMLDKMSKIPEGTGTMLDNTTVLWCNELSRGNSHARSPMILTLAGGGAGLQMGRLITFPSKGGPNHNNLLVSLLNAYGDPATTFGNPAYCTGPLSGL